VWTAGVYTTEGTAIQFLLLNTGSVELRRALAVSVDDEALAELRGGGSMGGAGRLIPAALPGYPPIKPLQRTRDAHTKGPVPSDDTTLQFLVPNYLAARKAAAVMIRRWAEQLGVRAAVVPLSAGALLERVAAGEFDVALAGHTEPLPHPLGILESPFLRPIRHRENGVAALLELARRAAPDQALSYCARAETLLLHDRAAVAPLLRSRSIGLITPRITGLTPNVLDEHRLRYFRVETGK
jgi:hypothetical protein